MTIAGAIKEAETAQKWFRPVSWRGQGIGMVIRHGIITVVPTEHGGHWWAPEVCLVYGDWEVVDPDDVMKEQP